MHGITSILHISDLHRSRGHEITNRSLLASLITDRDKYSTDETPKIKPPDIIIVSGDVIHGSAKPMDSEIEVEAQYNEAMEFLDDLTNQFLDGDKKRLIVIPGNHDINWKYSRESMTKIDSDKIFDESKNVKSEWFKEVINQNSKVRWSWKDLSFYEITSYEIYHKRLQAFSNFYSNLYHGERTFSLDPQKQFGIFDFPQYNLTLAAFSSCYNNDHLRLVGDINPVCIADASIELRSYKKKGRLILATWHHNTKGLPYDSNYMDNSKLKNFIDSGIAIGFHGHQHKTELIREFSDIIEQKKIIVLSTGTLCGGPDVLPVGNNRQYNLVEINWGEESQDIIDIELHTREKTDSSSFENPIWKPGRIDSFLISHYSFSIPKPKQPADEEQLIEIENIMHANGYEAAKKMLLKLDLNNDFVRKYLNECIIKTEDFGLALKVFVEPRNEEELITVLNAALQLNNKSKMTELVIFSKKIVEASPLIKEYTKKIEVILK